ncbi:hypothetical protein LPJ72_003954 [Coemansia sp. Benny D160-2]|nr:hypothetical protein LPJ72_003954 [Coemansia sp. Benny D160-2]
MYGKITRRFATNMRGMQLSQLFPTAGRREQWKSTKSGIGGDGGGGSSSEAAHGTGADDASMGSVDKANAGKAEEELQRQLDSGFDAGFRDGYRAGYDRGAKAMAATVRPLDQHCDSTD